jgi:three-Cys-motif partner protein
MPERSGRSWGFWTREKLRILRDYLAAFLTASSSQSERIYLDAFAGEGTGVDRLTGEEFSGSCRIALEADQAGGFTRFRFFEQEGKAAELEAQLRSEFADRDIRVYGGDCNEQIPRALAGLRDVRWAPTFAFIDPDGMEFRWQTLEALADHKIGYRAGRGRKPEFKVELWLLFPSAGLMRTLALNPAKLSVADARRATALFGTDAWRPIYERRKNGEYDPAEAREQYVNLMRWRLEKDLGYERTHPLELLTAGGQPLYHMIFASDHPAGTRIMTDLYSAAARRMPAMRKEARDRATGQASFDFGEPLLAGEGYRYEPPWEPPGEAEDETPSAYR